MNLTNKIACYNLSQMLHRIPLWFPEFLPVQRKPQVLPVCGHKVKSACLTCRSSAFKLILHKSAEVRVVVLALLPFTLVILTRRVAWVLVVVREVRQTADTYVPHRSQRQWRILRVTYNFSPTMRPRQSQCINRIQIKMFVPILIHSLWGVLLKRNLCQLLSNINKIVAQYRVCNNTARNTQTGIDTVTQFICSNKIQQSLAQKVSPE